MTDAKRAAEGGPEAVARPDERRWDWGASQTTADAARLPEAHFGRPAWLTLGFVLLLLALSTAQVAYRFFLPTDGWASDDDELDSADLIYFHNLVGLPSGLQPMDVLTGLEGQSLANFAPGRRPAFWQAGRALEYTVRRDGVELSFPVPIGHWTLGALLRERLLSLGSLLNDLGAVALFLVAFVAFWRRSEEAAARLLLILAAAIVASSISTLLPAGLSATFDRLAWTAAFFFTYAIFGTLIAPTVLAFTLVFPKPKPLVVRHPWLGVAPFGLGLLLAIVLYAGGPETIGWVTTMLMALAAVLSLAHSALTMRDALSRAQLLWALGGLGLGLALFLLNFPAAFDWVPANVAMVMVGLAKLGIPVIGLALAMAILRYRLFDIDVIIRRTLVYSVLTALLALVYFGSVVVLQWLLERTLGWSSTPAVVLSTLGIAALFAPLRRSVQSVIDRRFYRRKYDAEKVLAAFAATARDETDLDALTAELVRVIQETMQPESVAVWLRPVGAPEK